MKKILKICFSIVLILSLCFSFYMGILSWDNWLAINDENYPNELKLTLIISFFHFQFSVLTSIVILYNLFKHNNILNLTRYTYEEYKQKRIEEKHNRLNAKKEKLKKQLEEIEKTE